MGPEVFVAGRPLTSIDWWGELTVAHRWPLGSWEAAWSMPLQPWRRPPQLTANAAVEVRVGGWPIWAGNLAEPDWATGRFAAVGACRQGETAICLDSGGNTTSIPDTAVDQAIARAAVNWTKPASISAVAFAPTAETRAPNYVAALLDAYALSANKRWFVDQWRAVRLADDPTVPTAAVMPDNGVLGVATETQAAKVYARYLDSTSGAYATVSYGSGRPERGVLLDPEKVGSLSAAQATARAQAIWAPLQAQTGWTNGITVAEGELLTLGNRPKALWNFAAGQMVRLLGVRDMRGLSTNTDVVIGESVWNPGQQTLTINPVGMVDRDFASIIESVGGTAL
jgi:hypothetical protein